MSRKRGPREEHAKVLCVRVPTHVAEDALRRCGGKGNLAEWLRAVIRHACTVPLDFQAGYEEGKMQGWADASAKFREAMKGARA